MAESLDLVANASAQLTGTTEAPSPQADANAIAARLDRNSDDAPDQAADANYGSDSHRGRWRAD